MYRLLTLTFTLISFLLTNAQQKELKFSGIIKSAESGEGLLGATVYVKELKRGVSADGGGVFIMHLPKGKYTVTVMYLGFMTQEIQLDLQTDKKLDIKMQPVSIEKKEVLITGTRTDKNVTSTEVSRIELTGEKIKTLPVIF